MNKTEAVIKSNSGDELCTKCHFRIAYTSEKCPLCRNPLLWEDGKHVVYCGDNAFTNEELGTMFPKICTRSENLELISTRELYPENLNVWRNSLERRMRERGMWVLKKGIESKSIEIKNNKRSSSAKLRIAERVK